MKAREHGTAEEHEHPHIMTSEGAEVAREPTGATAPVLTIRALSGISGDRMLAGLMRMNRLEPADLAPVLASVLPELSGCLELARVSIGNIGGWRAVVSLPKQHAHRSLADIESIIAGSHLAPRARELAADCFGRVARAEGQVHGLDPREVHFHEVGALDSILDILLACELFVRLAPRRLVASPLPVADGAVACAHGLLPSPAPAVLEMLPGVPVRPFAGEGETITPTGLALLLCFGAEFGPWPAMRVRDLALVYGTRHFANAPNGAIFACGESA